MRHFSRLLCWCCIIALTNLPALAEKERPTFILAPFHPLPVRVSLTWDGQAGNGDAYAPALAAQERFVAFVSVGNNFVPGDTNGRYDIFVRDMLLQETTRVSVASDGTQGNANSGSPSISADGRFVAFKSEADNLVAGDTNNQSDIFVHDTLLHETRRVSVASDGTQGNDGSMTGKISANGRYITFMSWSNNLVPNDTNGWADIFVYDLLTQTTTRVSVWTGGAQGLSGGAYSPDISADGRYVAFNSWAPLSEEDRNGAGDIYIHDRDTLTTILASIATDGTGANYSARELSISADARFVAFSSVATTLDAKCVGYGQPFQVFVRDTLLHTTECVSVTPTGLPADDTVYWPTLSPDGHYLAFSSSALNLFAPCGPTADLYGRVLYLYDMHTHKLACPAFQGKDNTRLNMLHPVLTNRTLAFDSNTDFVQPGSPTAYYSSVYTIDLFNPRLFGPAKPSAPPK